MHSDAFWAPVSREPTYLALATALAMLRLALRVTLQRGRSAPIAFC